MDNQAQVLLILRELQEEVTELRKRISKLEEEGDEVDRLWEPAYTQAAWKEENDESL